MKIVYDAFDYSLQIVASQRVLPAIPLLLSTFFMSDGPVTGSTR